MGCASQELGQSSGETGDPGVFAPSPHASCCLEPLQIYEH